MIVTYVKKPSGMWDELTEFKNSIKPKHIQSAKVILDFKELKVVKASMGGVAVPRDWDRIISYYYQHYASTIERLLKENGYEIVKDPEQPAETQPT